MKPQPSLFPFTATSYARQIKSDAGRRNAYGELIEVYLAELLGAFRLASYTEDLCPDLKWQGIHMEVKSSNSKRWIIYPWRMRRELLYSCSQHSPYLYALVGYSSRKVKVGELLTVDALKTCQTYIGCISEIAALCCPLPVRKIKNTSEGVGYHRKGYAEGYVELSPPDWPEAFTLPALPPEDELPNGILAGSSHESSFCLSPRVLQLINSEFISLPINHVRSPLPSPRKVCAVASSSA